MEEIIRVIIRRREEKGEPMIVRVTFLKSFTVHFMDRGLSRGTSLIAISTRTSMGTFDKMYIKSEFRHCRADSVFIFGLDPDDIYVKSGAEVNAIIIKELGKFVAKLVTTSLQRK